MGGRNVGAALVTATIKRLVLWLWVWEGVQVTDAVGVNGGPDGRADEGIGKGGIDIRFGGGIGDSEQSLLVDVVGGDDAGAPGRHFHAWAPRRG